jgi:hypothetical protein
MTRLTSTVMVLGMLVVVGGGPAWGKDVKGNDFYETCRGKGHPCALFGMGYIYGFSAGTRLSKRICLKGGVVWAGFRCGYEIPGSPSRNTA